MGLNWNEIKSRALQFSKTWADACNENSQAKPFWIDFFEIFGITNKRVGTFELHSLHMSQNSTKKNVCMPCMNRRLVTTCAVRGSCLRSCGGSRALGPEGAHAEPALQQLVMCRQRLHAHHGTRSQGAGKALDCSHGWRAPASFDACVTQPAHGPAETRALVRP